MTEFEKACEEVDKDVFTGDYEQENAIEFIKHNKIATATFSQKSWITKILKLAEKYPEDVEIVAQNKNNDGTIDSIVVHFPVKFIHIGSKKRVMTEEQKQAAAERLKIARQKRYGNKELTAEEELDLKEELEDEDDNS